MYLWYLPDFKGKISINKLNYKALVKFNQIFKGLIIKLTDFTKYIIIIILVIINVLKKIVT